MLLVVLYYRRCQTRNGACLDDDACAIRFNAAEQGRKRVNRTRLIAQWLRKRKKSSCWTRLDADRRRRFNSLQLGSCRQLASSCYSSRAQRAPELPTLVERSPARGAANAAAASVASGKLSVSRAVSEQFQAPARLGLAGRRHEKSTAARVSGSGGL